MAREEFGFAGDGGRISLPCDAAVVQYAMCLLRRDASEEVVRAFLSLTKASVAREDQMNASFLRSAVSGAAIAPYPLMKQR